MNPHVFPTVKILIVDDKSENLLALQAAFKGTGYQLIEALSGREALEKAKHHDFACVLLDVQMPGMDGFETASALRRIPRAENTPIIFVTAIHRSEEYEIMGYVAGAVDYLFKPINTNILLAKVSIFVNLFLQNEEIKRKNYLLEEAIQRTKENEELREALKSRDEFLLMATHELKTPITPLYLQMQSFIQLFESGLAATIDSEKLVRMLKTSQGQVERLSRLVTELVDVSKLSMGKLEVQFGEMDLVELTQKVLIDFEAEIKNAGCLVSLNFESKVTGHWDRFRLEQVVVNLLTNALKYAPGKPIEIYLGADQASAYFSMRDHGMGIDPADHKRIFKRFERAVSNRNYSGLGLGLFISSQIMALHHGELWVESEVGQGAIFRFRLPRN